MDILDLNEAIRNLEDVDSAAVKLVKFRYFAGLTMKQIAEIPGMSPRSAEKFWTFVRTWRYQEFSGLD